MDDDFLFLNSAASEYKSIDTVNSEAATAAAENFSSLASQIEMLREQLAAKSKQNEELSECLVKQTSFCENLSEMLRASDQRRQEANSAANKYLEKISQLEEDKSRLFV